MARRDEGWSVTVGGRQVPSVGCGVAYAMSVLAKEDQERELAVIEHGVVVQMVETRGDGVVTTRAANGG